MGPVSARVGSLSSVREVRRPASLDSRGGETNTSAGPRSCDASHAMGHDLTLYRTSSAQHGRAAERLARAATARGIDLELVCLELQWRSTGSVESYGTVASKLQTEIELGLWPSPPPHS